jgi:hypothetical protein
VDLPKAWRGLNRWFVYTPATPGLPTASPSKAVICVCAGFIKPAAIRPRRPPSVQSPFAQLGCYLRWGSDCPHALHDEIQRLIPTCRGASGTVRHGETVNPFRNRKSGNGNPSPTLTLGRRGPSPRRALPLRRRSYWLMRRSRWALSSFGSYPRWRVLAGSNQSLLPTAASRRYSENLSLDAGSPTPAVHRVLSPVSSTASSAFPTETWVGFPRMICE